MDQHDGPQRRPFGFVEDHPVIRRIGEHDLFLGNRLAVDPARHDRAFEFVLTLASDTEPLTTHHRPLVDGPGNDWSAFESTVDTARWLFRRDGSLLVHCTAGISRSSTVLAATLAAEERTSLAEAFDVVLDARPSAVSHPALRELAVVYLAARTESSSHG
ncbi:dual specificity protein phosphatase family protein [Halococcus sp. IIIV-5B]|uniref:protein-tyrosine phosphatase family protein n=1 Tax=Halococcus sp. IIIV-5B TaxID=2321230 RepID=UPI001F420FF8|nr:dual specificity protein phosphatase [Halococcus sp. IIIV-5B]